MLKQLCIFAVMCFVSITFAGEPPLVVNATEEPAQVKLPVIEGIVDLIAQKKEKGEVAGVGWKLSEGGISLGLSPLRGQKVTFGKRPAQDYQLTIGLEKTNDAPKGRFVDFILNVPIGNQKCLAICVRQLPDGNAVVGIFDEGRPQNLQRSTHIISGMKKGSKHQLSVGVTDNLVSVSNDGELLFTVDRLNTVRAGRNNEISIVYSPAVGVLVNSCTIEGK